jgi:hypothetical protein
VDLQATAFPPGQVVDVDPQAFDDMIRGHGISFVHWRALPCPIGMVDADDQRAPHGDHHGQCSNGFLYRAVGPVTCIPSQNSNDAQWQDMGIVNQVNLMVTAERFYALPPGADGQRQRVYLAPWDRLYLAEESITVTQWQTFEACRGPTDKMDYPVEGVELCVDAQGRDVLEGRDFQVRDGLLHWVPGGSVVPAANPEAGTGPVISIRYRYRPYYYVASLPHEIRVAQATDPGTGARGTLLLNQQAVLQREFAFENQENDEDAPDVQPEEQEHIKSPKGRALGKTNLRQGMAPRRNQFGPR